MGLLGGKAVVITGAGQGIGAACARSAARLGAAVVVNDIDRQRADAVVEEINSGKGRAVAEVGDVSSWVNAERLITRCVDEFGQIDGLVNNAAVLRPGRIDEASEQDLRLMFEVNALGVAFCTAHASRRMIPRRQGSIVNVSSGSHAGDATLSGYAGTKGAVASFTYSWAMELAEHNVRVNALLPLADTKMRTTTDEYRAGIGLEAYPALHVSADGNTPVVDYLLSDLSKDVNGQLISIFGSSLALITHTARLHPDARRKGWTAESIAEAFSLSFKERLLPLGLATVTVETV